MNTALLLSNTHLSRTTLSGQVAIVTGAGRGIGRETARALAWLGARVVVAELNDVLGTETRQIIASEGGEALFIRTDVSDTGSVAGLARQVHTAYGIVSILVNNAIYICEAPVAEMSLEDWDRTLAVNLRGAFLTCQTFLPEMLAKKRSVIVNMISTDAMPGLSAYIASKQGITGFSQSLAIEVSGQGVSVIPFGPGMVDTPGIRSVAERLAPRLGMSPEQFLSIPLHPAFDGLMPAEYAGAATAYLIAVLAEEFHGEVVTGYDVLERAGLIQSASASKVNEHPSLKVEVQPVSIAELVEELKGILKETDAEFEQLPFFVRPMARGGFKSRTGGSTADWQRWLSRVETGDIAPADMSGQLEKLAEYYRSVPAETARFTKDTDLLREVAQACEKRIAVVGAVKWAISK